MRIDGGVALVTGAGRGLGTHFVRALLDRGASVYATARDTASLAEFAGDARVRALALDVTDAASVSAAAAVATDTTLVVNNAGVFTGAGVLGDISDVRREFEVNVWGTLATARAFAPVLARNGGGAILNVASVASWASTPGNGAYSASKAAVWGVTNALRVELAAQRTLVTALHFGATETEMLAGVDMPKNDPADIVRAALDGVEAAQFEVIADELAASAKAALSAPVEQSYPHLAERFEDAR